MRDHTKKTVECLHTEIIGGIEVKFSFLIEVTALKDDYGNADVARCSVELKVTRSIESEYYCGEVKTEV